MRAGRKSLRETALPQFADNPIIHHSLHQLQTARLDQLSMLIDLIK